MECVHERERETKRRERREKADPGRKRRKTERNAKQSRTCLSSKATVVLHTKEKKKRKGTRAGTQREGGGGREREGEKAERESGENLSLKPMEKTSQTYTQNHPKHCHLKCRSPRKIPNKKRALKKTRAVNFSVGFWAFCTGPLGQKHPRHPHPDVPE